MLRLERTNPLAQRPFLSPLLILGEGEGEVTRYGPRHRFRLRPLTLRDTTAQNYSRFEARSLLAQVPADEFIPLQGSGAGGVEWSGRLTKNVEPFPASLSNQIRPPWASTILRAMDRPNPLLFSPPVGLTLVR